jgi:hypothetical protein
MQTVSPRLKPIISGIASSPGFSEMLLTLIILTLAVVAIICSCSMFVYILGAVCPQRRATAALVLPAADTDAMSMHLAEIGRRVAPGAHAALVIDGAGYHVAARLAVPRNITLVRLPPYAP